MKKEKNAIKSQNTSVSGHNTATQTLVPNLNYVLRTQQKRILALCRKWLKHPRDAEDACQETFLRVTRAWSTFRSDCKVESWIFLIALNVCRNFNRRARRRRFDYAVEYNDALSQEGYGAAPISPRFESPDSLYERIQFLKQLEAVVAELSTTSQEVLRLKIAEGMTYDEVGDVLGIAAGTVKSRIHRARSKLMQCIEMPTAM